MVTKQTTLARIQVLDEREPDAARLLQTKQIRLALQLMDGIVKVGELNEYPVCFCPDDDLNQCCLDADAILTEQGFPGVPADARDRTTNIIAADHTPLVKARWRVTSTKEILRRLRANGGNREIEEQAERQLTTALQQVSDLGGVPQRGLFQETRFSLMSVRPDGQLEVRLRKCVLEDGELISPPQYHRTVLAPTGKAMTQMDMVNEHLPKLQEPYPPLAQSDMDRIERIVRVEHSPNIIQAYLQARRV